MKVSGGSNLGARLADIARNIAKAKSVRVGFIDGATYPTEAHTEEFLKGLDKRAKETFVGPMKARQKVSNKLGTFRLNQKSFVGPLKQPVVLKVAQVAWWDEFGTKTSKPRPFMRNTIADQSPTWGKKLAVAMKMHDYDSAKALALLGENIKDQFVKAIVDWPADNSPLTVAIKGFNKGLVHRGIMQRHIGFEVNK